MKAAPWCFFLNLFSIFSSTCDKLTMPEPFWLQNLFWKAFKPSTEIFETVHRFYFLAILCLDGCYWLKCITSVFLELRCNPIIAASISTDASISWAWCISSVVMAVSSARSVSVMTTGWWTRLLLRSILKPSFSSLPSITIAKMQGDKVSPCKTLACLSKKSVSPSCLMTLAFVYW